MRRSAKWLVLSAVFLAAAAPTAAFVYQRAVQSRLLAMLHSSDPGKRKDAAWKAADGRAPRVISEIWRAVEQDSEANDDVREMYVYALGRAGTPQQFGAVAMLTTTDRSGYVRQAAWLTMERLDAARFIEIADSFGGDDAWDRLGIAAGRLELGDARDIQILIDIAWRGNPDQKKQACRALDRSLRQLLETAGRWPLGQDPGEGTIWPGSLLDAVERRCRGLNLTEIARDTLPHVEATRRIRRDVLRITGARERIARVLQRI